MLQTITNFLMDTFFFLLAWGIIIGFFAYMVRLFMSIFRDMDTIFKGK